MVEQLVTIRIAQVWVKAELDREALPRQKTSCVNRKTEKLIAFVGQGEGELQGPWSQSELGHTIYQASTYTVAPSAQVIFISNNENCAAQQLVP